MEDIAKRLRMLVGIGVSSHLTEAANEIDSLRAEVARRCDQLSEVLDSNNELSERLALKEADVARLNGVIADEKAHSAALRAALGRAVDNVQSAYGELKAHVCGCGDHVPLLPLLKLRAAIRDAAPLLDGDKPWAKLCRHGPSDEPLLDAPSGKEEG